MNKKIILAILVVILATMLIISGCSSKSGKKDKANNNAVIANTTNTSDTNTTLAACSYAAFGENVTTSENVSVLIVKCATAGTNCTAGAVATSTTDCTVPPVLSCQCPASNSCKLSSIGATATTRWECIDPTGNQPASLFT